MYEHTITKKRKVQNSKKFP